ncbi:Uncharacterised protein [uncultured archaeon]|nr:Uncharacterised protein [uncultured archaeon]
MPILLHIRSASSRYWVVISMVTPSLLLMLLSRFHSFVLFWTSSPVVGSSSMSIGGLCMRPLAMSNLLFIPPEKVPAKECLNSVSSTMSKRKSILFSSSFLGT